MTQGYTIKTEVFEGPLDLLLTLIEKRKLLINDISLAAATDNFIEYVNRGESIPLSQRAHFVLVASTLLLIKSKSLLPTLELSDEETESVEDLERRLKLYKLFREQSRILQEQFGKTPMYMPNLSSQRTPTFSPHKDLTVRTLFKNVRNVLTALPQKELIPQVIVDKVISLEEMIEKLTERITKNLNLSFKEFANATKTEKVQVIMSFLAMLELVKQGVLSVTQDEQFEDILMKSDQPSTPRYT